MSAVFNVSVIRLGKYSMVLLSYSLPLDRESYDVNAINRDDIRGGGGGGNQPPSIFLGVILFGMNKPRQ